MDAKNFITLWILIVFFASCKKENRFDCVKRTGEIQTEKRVIADFSEIEVFDNMQLFLVQDTLNYAEIKAGKNLLKNIEMMIVGQKLILKNNNKCNFTRSYKNGIQIHLHFKKLNELLYKGTGPITSINAIVNEQFTFNSWDGTDSVKLNLEVPVVYANIHTGVADLMVTGHCNQLFAYAMGSGAFRMLDFKCKNVYANNISSSDQYFNVENKLEALVQYVGSTYYKGHPTEVIKNINQQGKLIQIE